MEQTNKHITRKANNRLENGVSKITTTKLYDRNKRICKSKKE